jgi:hypothetical protein
MSIVEIGRRVIILLEKSVVAPFGVLCHLKSNFVVQQFNPTLHSVGVVE